MEVLLHEASNGAVPTNCCAAPPPAPPPENGFVPQVITCCARNGNQTKCLNNCALQQQDQKLQQEIQIISEKKSSPFAQLKEEDSMDIMFENTSYTVSLGFRKGKKKILHNINGRLPARQLIALMGPSGAGKSTLLDVLSGYRITGVQGTVYVNGVERNLESFRRSSAYITQDDRLQPLLTVLENMHVAADLKLGTDTPRCEKETIIEEILSTLGLYEHLYTLAGRLSGGQKKRLSIALELVNNPTVLFLDEPTTGLDSSSCMQVCSLLKLLARQGRTIICTIHQPSATTFQLFDQVYILASGECLYQGSTKNLIPYFESVKLPCPMYHNPADYVIELACGEYGKDKIETLVKGCENGNSLKWFSNPELLMQKPKAKMMRKGFQENIKSHQPTSQANQIIVLIKRGIIKTKRDSTLTHLRILVNVLVGLMLGGLFYSGGNNAEQMIANWNLLFACLIHHMMTTMMLTVLTFPAEMNILKKEHFNRWYSLKAYYTSITLVDLPVMILCCFLFTSIVYFLSGQPHDYTRFGMFFSISLLIAFVAQSFGLMVGAACDVVNGTFLAPTLSVPMMMFAGFGVPLDELPFYLQWGTYISYLRYGLEGYVQAILGMNRPAFECKTGDKDMEDLAFCLFKNPSKFLKDVVKMKEDQFWNDVTALFYTIVIMRIAAFVLLRWKLMASR